MIQNIKSIDFNAWPNIASCKYRPDVGPADYVLPVNKQPFDIIEVEQEKWGKKIAGSGAELQSQTYATATPKNINNKGSLRMVNKVQASQMFYQQSRSKSRYRESFTFHHLENLTQSQQEAKSMKAAFRACRL